MVKKMNRANICMLSLTLLTLLVVSTSCSGENLFVISPGKTPETGSLCPAIQPGIAYLKAQYNPEVGLIREAPNIAPSIYWLTNDNALAAFTLAQLGENEFSNTLSKSIRGYGKSSNGLIEILWGKTVKFPPHIGQPVLIKQIGEVEIWQENHTNENYFEDWREYTNLALLGALNAENKREHEFAVQIYYQALERYDDIGFKDKAFIDQYETYKLALALYAGSAIGQPSPYADEILDTLLAMQNSDGGFFTHYTVDRIPQGDTNTETTAFALLALKAAGCGD